MMDIILQFGEFRKVLRVKPTNKIDTLISRGCLAILADIFNQDHNVEIGCIKLYIVRDGGQEIELKGGPESTVESNDMKAGGGSALRSSPHVILSSPHVDPLLMGSFPQYVDTIFMVVASDLPLPSGNAVQQFADSGMHMVPMTCPCGCGSVCRISQCADARRPSLHHSRFVAAAHSFLTTMNSSSHPAAPCPSIPFSLPTPQAPAVPGEIYTQNQN